MDTTVTLRESAARKFVHRITVELFRLPAPEGEHQLMRDLPFQEDSRLDRLRDIKIILRPLQLIAVVGKPRLPLHSHLVTVRGDEVISDLVDFSILIDHSRHRNCQDGFHLLQAAAERADNRPDKHALQDDLQVCLIREVQHGEGRKRNAEQS